MIKRKPFGCHAAEVELKKKQMRRGVVIGQHECAERKKNLHRKLRHKQSMRILVLVTLLLTLLLYETIKDPGLKLYVIAGINLFMLIVLALSGFFTDEPN